MRKLLSRVAVSAACVIGLTAGMSGTASADEIRLPILPGCWGTLGAGVCDVSIVASYDLDSAVYVYTWQLEVCTGTCTYYDVPFAWTTGQEPDLYNVCVEYRNRYDYYPTQQCVL